MRPLSQSLGEWREEERAMDDAVLSLLDNYLGDIIERVVRKYRYNVDVYREDEYTELLNYIYRRLLRSWFNNRRPSLHELEEALAAARKHKKMLEILVSYLVSRYAARYGRIYAPHGGDLSEEHY